MYTGSNATFYAYRSLLEVCAWRNEFNGNETIPTLDLLPVRAPCVDFMRETIQEFIANLSPKHDLIFTIIHLFLSSFGAVGNGVIVALYLFIKKMRTRNNFLIANLAMSNFFLSCMLYPLWLPDRTRTFPWHRSLCKFSTALPAINLYVASLTIGYMAVERYYVALNHQKRVREKKKMAGMIWGVASVLSIPFLVVYDTAHFPPTWTAIPTGPNGTNADFSWTICTLAPQVPERYIRYLGLFLTSFQVFFLYILPLFLILHFNGKLNREITITRQRAKRTSSHGRTSSQARTQRSASSTGLIVQHFNSLRVSSPRSSAGSAMGSDGRMEIATSSYDARRRRLTRLLLAMSLSYGILYLPYTMLSAGIDLSIIQPKMVQEYSWIDHACKVLWKSLFCVNPLIYGFFNTNYRREIRKIACRLCRKEIKCSTQERREELSACHASPRTRLLTDNGHYYSRSPNAKTSAPIKLTVLNEIPPSSSNTRRRAESDTGPVFANKSKFPRLSHV